MQAKRDGHSESLVHSGVGILDSETAENKRNVDKKKIFQQF